MRRTATTTATAILLALAGCSKGVTETGIDVNGPAIAVVTVTPTTASVQTGATQQFSVSFSPVPPDTKVVWTVTDTITASIDQTGKLTAKSPGKTTVRAILQINVNTQGAAPVTVTP
jgi:uncharacterized protein YjdB